MPTAWAGAAPRFRSSSFDERAVRVTSVAVTHGRAVPALAYRFDTADGSVVFSGDTSVNKDLIAFAEDADILVHQVADLSYLRRHGMDDAELARMAALHTDVTRSGASPNAPASASSSSATTCPLNQMPSPMRNGLTAQGRASAAKPPQAATAFAKCFPPQEGGHETSKSGRFGPGNNALATLRLQIDQMLP